MQQEQLVAQQDNHLQIMSESVGNLRNVSGAIGNELDEQAVMLDEFGTEIENAESKLDATMRKMVSFLINEIENHLESHIIKLIMLYSHCSDSHYNT